MVFGLFGVNWVMPLSVVGLFACWQGHFGRLHNGVILEDCSFLFDVVYLERDE